MFYLIFYFHNDFIDVMTADTTQASYDLINAWDYAKDIRILQ